MRLVRCHLPGPRQDVRHGSDLELIWNLETYASSPSNDVLFISIGRLLIVSPSFRKPCNARLLRSFHRSTIHPSLATYKSKMANPLDTEAGTELFSSYEAEFKLVQADLTQKLDQIPELSGEPRKAALSQAERALEEANELVRLPYPKHVE